MTTMTSLESRVATLINAYADRAPISVDPMAMARMAAAGQGARARVSTAVAGDRGLAFAVVLVALLAMLVTGVLMVGSNPFRRDPDDILTQRVIVPPFTGLPPDGAPVSEPETGQVVLKFSGHVDALRGNMYHLVVYADGRLIWTRGLDFGVNRIEAFGGFEPTTALIEQRLTPAGLELLMTTVASARLENDRPADAPDSLPLVRRQPGSTFSGLTVRQGERLVRVDWRDSTLPGHLADLVAWMPADAWQDRRVGGYVPSRYAMCDWQNALAGTNSLRRVDELLRDDAIAHDLAPNCRTFPTKVAREIVSTLEADPGIDRVKDSLDFHVIATESWPSLRPILPDGEPGCPCGG